MFFKTHSRINPQTGRLSIYCRLVENSRNAVGGINQRSIMAAGFMDDVSTGELHLIADCLNDRISGQVRLIEDSPKVKDYVDRLYTRLVKEKRIDRVLEARKRSVSGDWQRVDMSSIENRDVREPGAEWMCLQTARKLGIDRYPEAHKWSDQDRDLALAHTVCRAAYPASELKTVRYMQENSSICELLGLDTGEITRDRLYGSSHRLYAEKDGLEKHLSCKTNDLFTLEDKKILYDLSNTYFEGQMLESGLARHGRSKEKRSDCPLAVFALAVNVEGFVKYSAIYEGNMADCNTMDEIIKQAVTATAATPVTADGKKRTAVIDAGIATKANLKTITEMGYDYVCVSRSSLMKYTVAEGSSPVAVYDRLKRPVSLIQVQNQKTAASGSRKTAVDGNEKATVTDNAYYLKVTSPSKVLKENSMYEQFCVRYEEGLEQIMKGISSKG